MAAVLRALLSDVKSGALWKGLWEAKNATCNDVLQQSEDLLASCYFAAAAVLIGGALEAHLKDLCERYNVSWQGVGSISKYKDSLSAAQKRGDIDFFSLGDAKHIAAWADLRNQAAHNPSSVSKSDESKIKNMLSGVRDFIDRVP